MTDWTSGQDAALIKMRSDGLSCRQMGIILGVSRNAIAGRVNRLHLAKLKRPTPKSPPRRRPIPIPKFLPPSAATAPVEPTHKGITIMELTEQTCRFPIGDPQQRDFVFCGNHTDRAPYCQKCSQIAYRPIGRQNDH